MIYARFTGYTITLPRRLKLKNVAMKLKLKNVAMKHLSLPGNKIAYK
jgi:hypothetical protein